MSARYHGPALTVKDDLAIPFTSDFDDSYFKGSFLLTLSVVFFCEKDFHLENK
jgi:hypothetical protein